MLWVLFGVGLVLQWGCEAGRHGESCSGGLFLSAELGAVPCGGMHCLLGSLVQTCVSNGFRSLWLDGILNLHSYLTNLSINRCLDRLLIPMFLVLIIFF